MTDNDMPGWKRNVRLFLTGQTISLLGSMLVMFAVMWHLTIETQSGAVLMMSIVFGMLPQAVMSIFGGVWADRHSRKLLIMGADTTIAVVTLGLALLMVSGVDDAVGHLRRAGGPVDFRGHPDAGRERDDPADRAG